MLFNTMQYVLFLPAVVLAYYLMPKESPLHMAACRKLLFLYAVESSVYSSAFFLYVPYLCQWEDDRKVTGCSGRAHG